MEIAYLDVGQFLELGIGLRNGRVRLEFQGYPVPVSKKPNWAILYCTVQLISKIIITIQKTN